MSNQVRKTRLAKSNRIKTITLPYDPSEFDDMAATPLAEGITQTELAKLAGRTSYGGASSRWIAHLLETKQIVYAGQGARYRKDGHRFFVSVYRRVKGAKYGP